MVHESLLPCFFSWLLRFQSLCLAQGCLCITVLQKTRFVSVSQFQFSARVGKSLQNALQLD